MRSTTLTSAVLASLIAACGAEPGAPTPAPTPDQTNGGVIERPDDYDADLILAPVVRSILPRDGAYVDPLIVVRVSFSQEMETATTAAAVTLACGGVLVPGSVAFDSTRTVLAYGPYAPLPHGECDLVIDESASDVGGNALLEPATARFEVVPPVIK